jgi:hypothetical protein
MSSMPELRFSSRDLCGCGSYPLTSVIDLVRQLQL